MARAGEKKVRLANVAEFKHLEIQWDPKNNLTPEKSYIEHTGEERRQHFGQFFTPGPIAVMMADWVASVNPKNILEPSVGTGVLLRAVGEFVIESKVTCVDIDLSPMQLARKSAPAHLSCNFLHADFLLLNMREKFDGILANPPYLRHHDISYEKNIYEEIGFRNNISISKACNLYILFLFEICRLLSEGGRAAVLVPADWMSSNAARCFREYLIDRRIVKEILYLDEHGHHIDGAITTSVVLLFDNNKVADEEFVVKHYSDQIELIEARTVLWKDLETAPKWNSILLGRSSKKNDSLINLSTIAKTKRGLATGANEFFHLTDGEVSKARISHSNLLPCIGNAKDVLGVIFSDQDLKDLAAFGARTKLVNFSGDISPAEEEYIEEGERKGFHKRFLLARRRPWYKNEQRAPAPIWAASFGRGQVRFIWNRSSAVNLTTYHCIYPDNLTDVQLAAMVCLLNSSPIQQRFVDHLRVLGGGLLKFQPNDLLSIEIPDIRILSDAEISTLNSYLVRLDLEMRLQRQTNCAEIEVMADLSQYVENLIAVKFEGGEIGITSRVHVQRCT